MAKNNRKNTYTSLAVSASAVLTTVFLYKIIVLVQDLKQGFQGAPNSFALWPALALAAYAYSKSDNKRIKAISSVIITILAVGSLVWLFGVSNAVNLQTKY